MLSLSKDEAMYYNHRCALIKANLLLSEEEGPDSLMAVGKLKYALKALEILNVSCLHYSDPSRMVRFLCIR